MEQLITGQEILRERVLPHLEGVRPTPGGYMARCPAHEDQKPSLSVSVGREQPVVLHCHAGCERDAILDKLGLTWDELCKPKEAGPLVEAEWTPHGPAAAVYDYRDETGQLLFQVLRTADKQFPQRVPDPTRKSGWTWRLGDTRRVPYRLPELIEAINSGRAVYITEGEKDADNLIKAGVAATSGPGGAGKWRPEYAGHFRDAAVVIVADKDRPGQAHARQVAATLDGVASSIVIVEAAAGKDASDHLAAGLAIDQLIVTWMSGEDGPADLAPDLHEFLAVADPPRDWVIPDMLERGDRLIFTGFEGLGKSFAVRQSAIGAAAGIQPFTGYLFEPQRVLVIDCENSERQNRKHFRRLERAARLQTRRVPDGGLHIIHRPSGIDLTRDDAAWLLERVTAHKPDLLVIGPLYRLHCADVNDESAARAVVNAIDEARVKVDCAVIIEAHAGHGPADRSRSVRPVGSSLFLRWPEFGMGIVPDSDDWPCQRVAIKPWRGARDERHWPTHLEWNSDPNGFPWADPGTPRLRAVPGWEESS